MNTFELRTGLHRIIDQIQNEELLKRLYELLQKGKLSAPEGVWDKLTEAQIDHVLLAFEESKTPSNLLDEKDMFKRPE